jgi:hypothetical protein
MPFGAHSLFFISELLTMVVQSLILLRVWYGLGRKISKYEQTMFAMFIFFDPISLCCLQAENAGAIKDLMLYLTIYSFLTANGPI